MSYAEIINNEIVRIHDSLPHSYRNISNLFALDLTQLADMAWSGNGDVRFYECVLEFPETPPPGYARSGPTWTIDHKGQRVVGIYGTQPITLPTPSVPASVSARQIRLWLLQKGIGLDVVDAAIDDIDDTVQREMIRVEWEWAPYIERSHPMLIPLAAALGLTEEQVDQAFHEANTI